MSVPHRHPTHWLISTQAKNLAAEDEVVDGEALEQDGRSDLSAQNIRGEPLRREEEAEAPAEHLDADDVLHREVAVLGEDGVEAVRVERRDEVVEPAGAAHRREREERADRLRAARDARRVAEHVGPAAEPERGRRRGLGVGVAAEARAEERGREAGAADHDRVGAARGDAEDLLRDELGLDDRAGAEREAAPRVDGLAGGADLRRRDRVLDAIDVKGGGAGRGLRRR